MFVVGPFGPSHDAAASSLGSGREPPMTAEAIRPAARHTPWYKILYVQVLIAIALGVLIGHFYPNLGKELKPLGDGFIALIKLANIQTLT
jgi:hypothetical protein